MTPATSHITVEALMRWVEDHVYMLIWISEVTRVGTSDDEDTLLKDASTDRNNSALTQ